MIDIDSIVGTMWRLEYRDEKDLFMLILSYETSENRLLYRLNCLWSDGKVTVTVMPGLTIDRIEYLLNTQYKMIT